MQQEVSRTIRLTDSQITLICQTLREKWEATGQKPDSQVYQLFCLFDVFAKNPTATNDI